MQSPTMGNKGAAPPNIDIESMERALDKITDSNQGSDMMGRGANFDINNDDNFTKALATAAFETQRKMLLGW